MKEKVVEISIHLLLFEAVSVRGDHDSQANYGEDVHEKYGIPNYKCLDSKLCSELRFAICPKLGCSFEAVHPLGDSRGE